MRNLTVYLSFILNKNKPHDHNKLRILTGNIHQAQVIPKTEKEGRESTL